MSLAPPFPVKINIKGAEDVVCVRRTYEEALERCASNLGISASQVELKIASHGQLFSIDPRDWSKLEPTDQLHALKKSKGKQSVRGDVLDSNPVATTTSTSAKRKVESVEISSGSSDEDETSTSTIDRSNSGSRKAIGVKDRERKRSKKDKVPIQTTSTSTSSLNRHNTPPPPSRIPPSTSTKSKLPASPHSKTQVPYRSGSTSSTGNSKSNNNNNNNNNKDVNKAMGNLTVQKSSRRRWQETDSKLLMRYIAMEFSQLERPLNPGHRDLVFENICRKHSGPGGDLYGRNAEALAAHAKEQFKTNSYQAPFTADLEAIFSRKTKRNSGPSQPMLEQDYFVPSPIKKPTKSSTSSSSSSSKLQSGKHQGMSNVLPRKVPHVQPHSQRPSNSTSTSAPTRVVSNSSSNSNSNSNRRRREDAESSSSEEESSSDSSDSDEDSDDSRDLADVDDRETTSASSHPQNEPGPPPKPSSSSNSTTTQNRNASHPNMTSNPNRNQPSNNNPNLNSSSNSKSRQPPPPSIEPSFSPPPPSPPPSVPRAASLAIKEDEEVDELLYDRDEPDPVRPVPSRTESRNLPIWAQSRRSSVVGGEDIKPDVGSLDNREGRAQNQNQFAPSTSTSTNVNRDPNSFNNNLPPPPPPPPKVSGTNSIPINTNSVPLGPRAMQTQGQNQSPAHHPNLSSSSPMVHRPFPSPTYGSFPHANPSNHVQGAMNDQAGPSNYMNQQQLHQPQQQPQVQPTEAPLIEVVIHHLPLGHDQDWINWLLAPFQTVEIKERIGSKSQLPFLIVKFESLDQARLAIQSLNGTQHGQGEALRFLKVEFSYQSAAKLKGMGLI